MKKALEEGFWIGLISILGLMAMFVWTVTIMEFVESPIARVSLIMLLMMAVPMTLSVIEHRQKRLLDEALSNQLKKDTKA